MILIVYLVNRQGDIEQNQQDAGLLTLKQSASTLMPTKAQSNATSETLTQTTDNNATELDNSLTKDLFRLTVKAKNHVWVEVKAVSNGEALFNGFLESGDKHDFSDKEGLRITAINGSIAVIASGKTSEFGTTGKTTEKIFSGNKVSQVAESQPGNNASELGATKTISPAPSSLIGQSTNISKKPVSETPIAKKPAPSITPLVKVYPP